MTGKEKLKKLYKNLKVKDIKLPNKIGFPRKKWTRFNVLKVARILTG